MISPALQSETNRRLRLGYLQVGPPEHGICRYGRMLAAEARHRSDIDVLERSIVLTGRLRADYAALRDLARTLSVADLVHLQVSIWGDSTWGRSARALWNLSIFRLYCRSALAVTLHDVNSLPALGYHAYVMSLRHAAVESIKGLLRPAVRLLRQFRNRHIDVTRLFRPPLWDFGRVAPFVNAAWVLRQAHAVFVLTRKEQ